MVLRNEAGQYAYLPGLRFASSGVKALPGMAIEQAVLSEPLPLTEGFEIIRRHLDDVCRPLAALCGVELRLPKTLSLDRFVAFNDTYLAKLDDWELVRDGLSPLTRTNVSPSAGAPREPMVGAFSYTVSAMSPFVSYVISGIAELPISAQFPSGVVRLGETGPDALLEKARCVVDVVDTHIRSLDVDWAGAAIHLYSAHDVAYAVQREVLAAQGITPSQGLMWHDTAPPVEGLELEIDVRRYNRTVLLWTSGTS
ncbi:hypothetical protein ETD83_05495 [Actinomadura soli]|uniref:Uncharacterized protein n=1 Tax=Actinomadura soli TaxID=2508997 RepID=A0A5C4JHV4_9ACTN|nr:hypothetical protein [Actinomadura soli]TMR05694.1 hypothetical protein ETD83_05495 [Actinomadura soli]